MPSQPGATKSALPSGSRNPLASLRGRLILLTAVLVVTAAAMAVGLLEDAAQRHRASAERQLGETARALSLAVDGEVLQRQAVLRTLAASPALQTGDLKSFEDQARASPPGSHSWIDLFDADGKGLVNTSLAPGATGPDIGKARFARSWKAVLTSGEVIGGVVARSGAPNRDFIIHLDELVKVKGQPTYDLTMIMQPAALQVLIEHQALPKGWYGAVVDRSGVTIARNLEPGRWVGKPAGGQLLQRVKAAPTGVFETTSRNGSLTLAGYDQSPISGWTVAVAMPRYEAAGDLGQSLQWLSIIGAALLILGGALTLWFVRGMARAVHSLEAYAESLGRGATEGPPAPTGLAETDFIALALENAAERLRAREQDLHRINETLEARVEEASAKLVQSQKIEVIGRLTGGVAHDFNNLLTAVIGNLELLRRKLTDERQLQFVNNARSAADRGAKLTAQLLAFARKQTLTREAVDVNALIGGMGELLASSVDGDTVIETDLDPDTPPALADRTQLEMVVLNLVINARDALSEGGIVRISTRREHIADPPARPEDPPIGDFTRITVADNGVGITREVMERIFEPFFTTKPPGRGSGLGLPQTLGVAQQLGGGVRIDSRPGEGAQVHVYLPIAQAEVASGQIAAPQADKPKRHLLARP